MNKITDKIKNVSDCVQKQIITTWNFKTTIFWGVLSSAFIIINIIFFLMAISFRHDECVNIQFDLPEFLLLTSGVTLAMILGSWMVNYIGGHGFCLSLVNFGYHLIFISWLLLSAVGGIILISFSRTECTDKPDAIFVVVPLYLLIHNMVGSLLISVYCVVLVFDSWRLYSNRHSLLDDLII